MTQKIIGVLRSISVGIFCLSVLLAEISQGQDLRIYTTIRDHSVSSGQSAAEKAPIVVSSLTLFHAGKVYDYIDPAREVTVFEPALRRFTVLNPRREVCASLDQDEIRQFLGLAETEAQKRLAVAAESSPEAARKTVELLRFQLQPQFIIENDPAKSQFTFTDGKFQYIVEGDQAPSTEILEKYLQFADWTAQLNSILHPQSLLPMPRLKVNSELRSRGIRPLNVSLKADTDPPLHLVAQHQWKTTLEKKDRQMIEEWERSLRDPKFRRMPFRQLQQETLGAEVVRKH